MTITLTREEAQQVLKGLENIAKSDWRKWEELADPKEFERWVKARANHMAETLRARLAQPEPEPPRFPTALRKMWSGSEVQAWIDEHYTAPPQREWQGLTDEDYEELLKTKDWGVYLIEATEDKLKEKNI
jgi:hypothetical protein